MMPNKSSLHPDDMVIKWDLHNDTANKHLDPISRLQRDPQLSSLIYKLNTQEDRNNISNELSGYEIFSITTDTSRNKKIQQGKFQALAAINRNTKEVIFVTAGTRLREGLENFLADAKDDLHLGLGLYPAKLKAAKKLNDEILKELGEEVANYKFHYTGHSLGAAMSDAAATDMGIKLHKKGALTKGKISTVTFDNPGAYTLVQNQLKEFNQKNIDEEINRHNKALQSISKTDQAKIKKETQRHTTKLVKIAQEKLTLNNEWREKVHYKAFNNRSNIINTADKQAGDKFIIVPSDQPERTSFSIFIGWVAKQFPGPIMKKILYLISYGWIETQVKEHSIENFINVLKQEKGELLYAKEGSKHPISLVDAAYNIKPVEYHEELFVKLKRKVAKRKLGSKDYEQPDYSMTFIDSRTGDGTRIEFTEDELSRAHRTPTKITNQNHPTQKTSDPIISSFTLHNEERKNATNLMKDLKSHLSNHNSSKGVRSKNNVKLPSIRYK